MQQNVVPFVIEATAVAGLGLTAATADADIYPSNTATTSPCHHTMHFQTALKHVNNLSLTTLLLLNGFIKYM